MPPHTHHKAAEFFAGIGLMRLGLEQAGWRVVFANDIDPDKRDMYCHNFVSNGTHFHLGDIHKFSADAVPDIQLATASFPCTDLSLAGSMRGINAGESSAFWGFVRILKEMNGRRPQMVLLENVVGFLSSHEGSDFRQAMTALNDLGYTVDPFVLDASWFVPQSRPRLFVVAVIGNERNLAVAESPLRPPTLVDFIASNRDIHWNLSDLPHIERADTTLADILEDLPADSPEWWPKERAQYFLGQTSTRHREIANAMISKRATSYATAFRRVRNGKSMAELRTDGIAGCLRTPKGGSARQILFKAGYGRYAVRLLTPVECARLMGADTYKIKVPLNQALFGFGDAVCVPAVTWIAQNYLNPVANHLANAAA